MRIKFMFGNNDSSNQGVGKLCTTFCYLSTVENGVADKEENEAPKKLSAEGILGVLSNNPDKIIALLNFENIQKDGTMLATSNAQGISDFPQSLYSMSIYKKEIWYDRYSKKAMEQPLWQPVALNSYATVLRDFNISNNRQYKYVFRLTENHAAGTQESTGGIIVPISTDWMGWSITELHPTSDAKVYTASPMDVWKFKYNISPGEQTQNISKNEQKTLGTFSVFSHGQQNAVSGSVQCLMGREIINANYINDEFIYQFNEFSREWEWTSRPYRLANIGGYVESLNRFESPCGQNSGYKSARDLGFRDLSSNESIDMLNQWRQICYSGNPKLLKDEKGQRFIVQIFNPSNTINETWERRPITISFNWMQIQSADDVRIIQETT